MGSEAGGGTYVLVRLSFLLGLLSAFTGDLTFSEAMALDLG